MTAAESDGMAYLARALLLQLWRKGGVTSDCHATALRFLSDGPIHQLPVCMMRDEEECPISIWRRTEAGTSVLALDLGGESGEMKILLPHDSLSATAELLPSQCFHVRPQLITNALSPELVQRAALEFDEPEVSMRFKSRAPPQPVACLLCLTSPSLLRYSPCVGFLST